MKKLTFILFVVGIGIFSRCWLGIYTHDEFGYDKYFIKYRPTWKWRFYSPGSMSDLRLEDMTPEKQKEELLFKEFVRDRGLNK